MNRKAWKRFIDGLLSVGQREAVVPAAAVDLGNMPAADPPAEVHVHLHLNGEEIATATATATRDAIDARD